MRTFSKAWVPALLLLLCFSGCGKRDQMTVVFPKVGSADCAILMTEDATVLIDTGEDGDGDKILKLLSEYGRDRIDLMLISHYDKDHVGGADQILKALPVRRVIGSTSPKESEDYSEYLEALAAAGLSEEIPKEKMELSYGALKLTVYPPKEEVYPSDQRNNSSTAVSAAFGET